ncbi:hypothetical protein ACFL21_02780 [Patescibacteria group bacterium]
MKRKFIIFVLVGLCLFLMACKEDLKRDLTVDSKSLFFKMLEHVDKVYLAQNEYVRNFDVFIKDKNREFYNLITSSDSVDLYVDKLDAFMTTVKFSSNQLVYREVYNEIYKPVMNDYVSFIAQLTTAIDKYELPAQDLYAYKPILTNYQNAFRKVNNKLIDTALGTYNSGLIELEF